MRRRPRFLLCSYNYEPEPTGIGAYTTTMARYLHLAHGWDVQVFTGIPHYPWWHVHPDYASRDFRRGRADETLGGVTVHRLPHFVPDGPPGGLARIRLDLSWLIALALRLARERRRPDYCFFVAPPFLAGVLARALARWWRVPVQYHVQDLQVDAAADLGMLPRPLCAAMLAIERWILRGVDVLSTVGRGMRRRLLAKDPARIRCRFLPNWADATAVQPATGANAYRREWGLNDEDVLVFYSGNMGRKQGLETLVTALAGCADDPRLHAVLAGSGAVRDEIAATCKTDGLDRIRLMDLQPRERLSEFLNAGDIHCLPQKRAVADLVLPSKLLNIMAAGKPVIACAEPSTELATIVRTVGCGLVVAPEDPAALRAVILALAADPARRQAMGVAARRYVEHRLSRAAVLDTFAARVRRRLARHRRG
ncbi:MAG: WcaI family glycosyltransferase [Planctomycetota bacterium]